MGVEFKMTRHLKEKLIWALNHRIIDNFGIRELIKFNVDNDLYATTKKLFCAMSQIVELKVRTAREMHQNKRHQFCVV